MKELLNCTKLFPKYLNQENEREVRRRSRLPFLRKKEYKILCELKLVCNNINKPGADLPELYDRFISLMTAIKGQTRICWSSVSERVSVLAYKELCILRERQKIIRKTLQKLRRYTFHEFYHQLYSESAFIYCQIKRLETTYNHAFNFTVVVHLNTRLKYSIEKCFI